MATKKQKPTASKKAKGTIPALTAKVQGNLGVKVAAGVAAVVVLFFVIVFSRPDQYFVEKEINIEAPVGKIFAEVNNLHSWEEWAPLEKADPDMSKAYSGAAAGQGAVLDWAGKAGKGKFVITESEKDVHVSAEIDMNEPKPQKSAIKFIFTPNGHETNVKLSMTGPNDFMSKLSFGAVDTKTGEMLQTALENIKIATQPGYSK